MGDSILLSSTRVFQTPLEAAEEALNIVGNGIIEVAKDKVIVYPYLKEPVEFDIRPVAELL